MATGSLGQLTIDLAANITRFERALNRAELQAQKKSDNIKRTFTRLAGGLTAAFAGFQLVRQVEQALDFADAIGKTADKLGISTDALQEFRFAAEQTGVATTALDVGIQRFTRRVGEAAQGQGVLNEVFNDLNIQLRDTDGNLRSTEDILGDYADAIKNAESEQEQLRLAFKAFDTEGVALVNLLRGGSQAISEYRNEARDLGIVLSEDVIRGAEEATDALNRVSKIISVGTTGALASLAPVITDVADAFTDLATGDVQNLPEVLKDIVEGFVSVEYFVSRVTDGLGALAATAGLILTGEFSKIQEVWNETGEAALRSTEELDAFINRLRQVRDVSDEITAGGGENPAAEAVIGTTRRLSEARISEIDAELEYTEAVLADAAKAHETYTKNRIRLEQEYSRTKSSLEQNTINNTLSLLSTLGRKSKGFAIAAIAVEKGFAITQAIIATNVAVMKAFQFYGPTPAGYAAAAQMKALGAFNVGLIAATGLAQISQVNAAGAGGGSTLGTPANPITTTESPLPFEGTTTSAGTTGTITINVNGVITDEIINDLMIPALQDSINDKDVILIRSDSRNALELTT